MGTEMEALQKGRLGLADLGAAWYADTGKVLRMPQGAAQCCMGRQL